MHTPVLLQEVIENLEVRKGARFIDATAGEGGHIEAILSAGASAVLAIDQDHRQIESLRSRYMGDARVAIEESNFSKIEAVAGKYKFKPVDGILFDLGISVAQLMSYGAGLSYKKDDELLDMRLSKEAGTRAIDILGDCSPSELYEIISKYSEEPKTKDIVSEIDRYRKHKKIETVGQLKEVIDSALQKKDERAYARIFQSLRIEVNNETDNLKKGLSGAIRLIAKKGRIAVISFHSIEDRIVKQFIRKMKLHMLTKHVISGKKGSVFERSAKLRVFGLKS